MPCETVELPTLPADDREVLCPMGEGHASRPVRQLNGMKPLVWHEAHAIEMTMRLRDCESDQEPVVNDDRMGSS